MIVSKRVWQQLTRAVAILERAEEETFQIGAQAAGCDLLLEQDARTLFESIRFLHIRLEEVRDTVRAEPFPTPAPTPRYRGYRAPHKR